MMTVLVTGGAGYVGSHICKALFQAGFSPVVFDDLSRGHKEAIRWGEFARGDITNPSSLSQMFAEYQPQAVIHCAARAYVGESFHNPASYYRINIGGTAALIEAATHAKVQAILFSGSCAVYGVPDRIPIDEDQDLRPINPYGMTKLVAERLLSESHAAGGIRFASLRYFNAAGADPDTQIGECHNPETHLIPLALAAAREKGQKLTVYGQAYATPDGSCIRDFIHVTDLARAHILALQRLLRGSDPFYLNLGTGQGYSVLEVIAAVEQVTGYRPQWHLGAPRSGDPPILIADPSRAYQELQWKPERSDLNTLISDANRWMSYLKQRHVTHTT